MSGSQVISAGKLIQLSQMHDSSMDGKVQVVDSFVGENKVQEYFRGRNKSKITSAELSDFDHNFRIQSLKEYKNMMAPKRNFVAKSTSNNIQAAP